MSAELAEPASKIELPAGVGGGGEIPSRSTSRCACAATTPRSPRRPPGRTSPSRPARHRPHPRRPAQDQVGRGRPRSTFRRSCAHGVCGSDAMRINGRNRLACKNVLKDVYTPTSRSRSSPSRACPGREGPRGRHGAVLRPPTANRSCRLLSPPERALQGTLAVRRGPGALRRHDQVHPLRGMHVVLPGVLDRRPVLRPRRDRERAPLHLRLPRRGRPTCAWTS